MAPSHRNEHTGASFGVQPAEPHSVPQKRPKHRMHNPAFDNPTPPKNPAVKTPGTPMQGQTGENPPALTNQQVSAGHPPITDYFGGFNRYVSGTSISLNTMGGLDIGNGLPVGATENDTRMVHIHTAGRIKI